VLNAIQTKKLTFVTMAMVPDKAGWQHPAL
jgi:hypothetical protein